MKEEDFDQLVASIRQSGAIRRGEMKPSRVSEVGPTMSRRFTSASTSLSRNSPS